MFADAFWPNFVFFALGQTVACLYLATGRVWRGGCLMLALLLLADVALVARFAYGADHVAVPALVLMQAYTIVEAGFLGFGRWHRRRASVLARRRTEYRAALVAELRGDDVEAAAILQRLCRRDPWDAESTLALAGAQRRLGHVRGARRMLLRARRLDRKAHLRDVILLESGRLPVDGVSRAVVVAESPRVGMAPAHAGHE